MNDVNDGRPVTTSELTPDPTSEGSWFVWGDGDRPLAEDVAEHEARRLVDAYRAAGRLDVYGEDNDGDGSPASLYDPA